MCFVANSLTVAIVDRVTGPNGLALVLRHLDGAVRWSAVGAIGHHELDLPTRGDARRAAERIAGPGSTAAAPAIVEGA